MQILGILGIYFDAAVVFVTNFSLLFRLSLAILWGATFNAQLWWSLAWFPYFHSDCPCCGIITDQADLNTVKPKTRL